MIYYVIGLMSGSSLDGLDICYAQYEEVRGQWSAQILASECLAYTPEWRSQLSQATAVNVPDFLRLHTAYGRFTGDLINEFIARHELEHKVHFIASHGHTVLHDPAAQTSFQLGDGASIAAVTGLPVVADLRSMDVALGGQGAPLVPVGEKFLFADYDLLLNIGGIANVTLNKGNRVAFDVCVANQALNALAQKAGKEYDAEGSIAASGSLLPEYFVQLCNADFYAAPSPKSLSNEVAFGLVSDFVNNEALSLADRMHTLVELIASQIAAGIQRVLPETDTSRRMLVTGGGAFNRFLVERISAHLEHLNVQLDIPDSSLIQYKEALIMGLIGILRWREEVNADAVTTGASRDSVGGAYWIGK